MKEGKNINEKRNNNNINKLVPLIFVLSFIFVILSTAGAVSADSTMIYVNDSGGSDTNDGFSWITSKKSIKSAIGSVAENGTVNIANGNYTGANNQYITIDKNVTISGQNKDKTIINGTNSGYIFQITNGKTVKIQNLKIVNATTSSSGGAIYNYYGNLTIINCILAGNHADGYYAGAIYNLYSNLTTENCIFIYNSANNGGAIYNLNSNLTVKNSSFLSNNATYGGAIYNSGNIIISGSTFTGNKATNEGGVIYTTSASNVNISSSTLENNIAGSNGGVILNTGNLTINSNRIVGNSANYGGAIFSNTANTLIANFNSIIGNSATSGSAIYKTSSGTFDVTNNWWGSNAGPSAGSVYGTTVSQWLVLTLNANPSTIYIGRNSTITADLLHDNGILSDPTNPSLYYHNPASGHVPDGIPVVFTTTLGTLSNLESPTVNGAAKTTLKGGLTEGSATVKATVDSQHLETTTTIIDNIKPTVTANLNSGYYNTPKTVILTASDNSDPNPVIHYTLNGSTPTTSSAKYTGPITISSTTTLKFFAVDSRGNPSSIYTQKYTIDKIAPRITSTTPRNYATRVSRTGTIAIRFSENIKASVYWSKIKVVNKYGKTVLIKKWISGNTIYIKTIYKRSSYSYYKVYVPYKSVKDYAGNNLRTTYSFKFKTGRY